MGTLRRALANSLVMLLSQAITWLATLILTSALGSHLGDAGFGNLYLAMSFAVIFGLLVDFGLNEQFIRAVARERALASSFLLNTFAIKFALAVVAYAATIVLTYALGYDAELRRTISLYSLVLFFNAFATTLTSFWRAIEHTMPSAAALVLEKVFIAVVAVVILNRGYGVDAVALVFVGGTALNTTWQALFLRGHGVRLGRIESRIVLKLLVGALPFFLYWALGAIYYRVDIILLSKMTSPQVVGWYSAAYRLFDTLFFLPGIVSSAIMLPILSRISVTSREQLRVALGKGLDLLLVLGIPISTGLYVLAEPILGFIYRRPEFLNAAPALRWLAIALLFVYANSVFSVVLISTDQEKRIAIVPALATIVNLVLNCILIPRYQHVAAAGVTAVTEVFILGYFLLTIERDLLPLASLRVLVKSGLAAGVMALVLHALRGQPLPLIIVAGGLCYGVVAIALRVIPTEDLRRLRQVIVSRRQPTVESEVPGNANA